MESFQILCDSDPLRYSPVGTQMNITSVSGGGGKSAVGSPQDDFQMTSRPLAINYRSLLDHF